MAELPNGVRGHTCIVMITIFFGEEAGYFLGEASTPQMPLIEPC